MMGIELAERCDALADELIGPLLCTTPAYGVPGHAHCAACCYGAGYIVTCDIEQEVVDVAKALSKLASNLRREC